MGPRLKSRRAAATRAQLQAACITLIAQKGLDGWTVEDLAATAGKSRGLAGHYFGKKGEFVSQVVRDLLKTSAPNASGDLGLRPLLNQLRAALRSRGDASTHRARLVVLSQARSDRVAGPEIARFNARRLELICTHLRSGLAGGEIGEIEVRPAAEAILAMHRGVELALLHREDEDGIDAIVESYISMVRQGLQRYVHPFRH